MKAAVEWKKTAIDELASIWSSANSTDRRAITAAAREIDELLKADAPAQGESREGDRRIMFVAPLAATFRIDPCSFKVEVLRLTRYS
ncbi:MAG TPA: hypothetical protein VF306_17745 [Pirellulales bacterium]